MEVAASRGRRREGSREGWPGCRRGKGARGHVSAGERDGKPQPPCATLETPDDETRLALDHRPEPQLAGATQYQQAQIRQDLPDYLDFWTVLEAR
jgi:hypothetical protein